jgi:hypothetical protein
MSPQRKSLHGVYKDTYERYLNARSCHPSLQHGPAPTGSTYGISEWEATKIREAVDLDRKNGRK